MIQPSGDPFFGLPLGFVVAVGPLIPIGYNPVVSGKYLPPVAVGPLIPIGYNADGKIDGIDEVAVGPLIPIGYNQKF